MKGRQQSSKRNSRAESVKLKMLDGITAGAVGAITGSVLAIAKRSLIAVPTVALAIATILLLSRFKKLQEPVVVAALFGLIV
jgi:chromate transporter